MAGRGRGMTLPAWMTSNGSGSVPGASASGTHTHTHTHSDTHRDAGARSRSPDGDSRSATKYDSDDRQPSRHSSTRDDWRGSDAAPAASAPRRFDTGVSVGAQSGGTGAATIGGGGLSAPPVTAGAPATGGGAVVDTRALIAAAMSRAATAGVTSAATKPARRLYVGGLPLPEATEATVTAFFNEVLDRCYQPTNSHVMSVYINQEKRFAFVEFRTPELATACLSLDGILFLGHPLKIKRPNDYNPALALSMGPPISLRLDALGMISSQVPDGPNKVFIGGVPYMLGEAEVKELLQAFGPLKALHLVRDPITQTSKGYAFCEWADPSVTEKAVAGLNGLQLGDKTLTVRRALNQGGSSGAGGPGTNGLDIQSLVAAATAGFAGVPMGMGPGAMATGLPAAPPPPSGSAAPPPPAASTRSLCMRNMLTEEDVKDDAEYQDVLADIREELGKYGSVTALEIPRSGPSIGNVYVSFETVPQAEQAQRALSGRLFASRQIIADFA